MGQPQAVYLAEMMAASSGVIQAAMTVELKVVH